MNKVLSVTEINRYINNIVSSDVYLSNVWVKGEISNFKHHSSGHAYFTLKDAASALKCVMFRSYFSSLVFVPEDGMNVVVQGYISVYERDGSYQLYVLNMQPDGTGALYIAFNQLKERLAREGLFDEKHKKPLPLLPSSVGIITSVTGAVIRDILNVLSRRFPNFNIKIINVAVQGKEAAPQICDAIRTFNMLDNVDVIIIARGGGSLEDLWAFNEEQVAYEVYNSRIPIISAVGHETDYTICDFAADMRAPTPSAAAEIVMPDKIKIKNTISSLESRVFICMKMILQNMRNKLLSITQKGVFARPDILLNNTRLQIDSYIGRAEYASNSIVKNCITRLSVASARLDALSPLKVLSRGYSIAKNNQNNYINSVNELEIGQNITLILSDGQAQCEVKKIFSR